ncbi:MAG: bile acid:sodium symporter [Pseudomonadota bacterium]
MTKIQLPGFVSMTVLLASLCCSLLFLSPSLGQADVLNDEQLFNKLSSTANGNGDIQDLIRLDRVAQSLDWDQASPKDFTGFLRIIRLRSKVEGSDLSGVYLLRTMTGEIYVLSVPQDKKLIEEGAGSYYAGLDEMYKSKMEFRIDSTAATVDGQNYVFARFRDKPQQVMLDKIFKISIVLMLFFVMVGMGLTLTFKDFSIVFTKPRGMIVGQILQFGAMPLLAFAFGHWFGFYTDYPFIFVGMILITAIPGGVTSNLMTYYAKGDLALSIALTSFSTILSLFFTPFLLKFYCANMPSVSIPVGLVMQTILILVIIPLIIGMSVRSKAPEFSKKATPFFSALGLVALLVLIVAGVFGNISVFSDTARYGLRFYSTVFMLTFFGMMSGIIFSKVVGINNYQTRAISLETGLRNAALAMTIAILIQDAMGDFYSSMLVTSGLFGLVMYVAGILSIILYKLILPLPSNQTNGAAAPGMSGTPSESREGVK